MLVPFINLIRNWKTQIFLFGSFSLCFVSEPEENAYTFSFELSIFMTALYCLIFYLNCLFLFSCNLNLLLLCFSKT